MNNKPISTVHLRLLRRTPFMLIALAGLFQIVSAQQGESPVIEDNSFFIEEAYNQEEGIVQHIVTGIHFATPERNLSSSFTQEWPFLSSDHQLSYTVPIGITPSSSSGIGDILLNYRYQLAGRDDWAALSPRFSVILPTGSTSNGTGSGVAGFEINLPASKRLAHSIVVHANAGYRLLPGVKSPLAQGGESRQDLSSSFLGASAIWLVTPEQNLILEWLTTREDEPTATGSKVRSTTTVLSPGFRSAVNVGSLQIVPGIAIPLSFAGKVVHVGVFLYVSFEHPF